MDTLSFEEALNILRMKRENPKDYEKFLEDYKGVLKDIARVCKEAFEELDEEFGDDKPEVPQ